MSLRKFNEELNLSYQGEDKSYFVRVYIWGGNEGGIYISSLDNKDVHELLYSETLSVEEAIYFLNHQGKIFEKLESLI